MMNQNKENFLKLVSETSDETIEKNRWRIKNRFWLKYSHSFFGSLKRFKFFRLGFSGTANSKPEIMQKAAMAKSIFLYLLKCY